ncbi:probable 39S ribosomal protein L45, mitochondrial [Schistocerca cancellata]|uniref:probable 39S ribosomal protein L45, mitochondrial n=1 Tax=Schistocerca cancellata TaxID=274614 RepID=UPI0021173655|nr:probable 39S ribosomal protein L45, mitochondrial [Schistocerca cancellata]
MAVTSGLSSGISRLRFLQKCLIPGTYSCGIKCTLLNSQHARCYKHWNPKFKRLRGLKVQKIELPNFEEDTDELSEEEVRSRLKERGLLPPRPWVERPFFISCTGGAFEPYVPPEGDGKMSIISVPGAKQKFEMVEKKSKSMMAIRKIRSFEEEFNTQVFTDAAQEIYINAHNCMASKDFVKLQQFVTERAYPQIKHNSEDKTIHWKFVKSLEAPRVVHARCTDIISKENVFAQVTVRFHTQQILAVYDRFGRLMHGSEILAKDVLEYVVFEKHMANQYGIWRIHDKIIPDWMPPREPMEKTYVKTEEPPVETQVQTVPENKAQETVSNV